MPLQRGMISITQFVKIGGDAKGCKKPTRLVATKLVQPLDVVNYKDRSDGIPRAQCDIPQTKSGALDPD